MHGQAAASGQVARHAENIEAVRDRFVAVHDASASMTRDDSAYGLLCRWITETFHAKHVRQDELFAYVEENLRLIGVTLRNVAKVQTPAPDLVRLAAGPSLIEPVTVRSGARLGWTMEDVEPLRDVLDRLTGKPDVIASYAATWHNMAEELWSMAEDLEDFVEYDIPGWHGDEAAEHRRLMENNVEAVKGLSSVSEALSEIVESVGVLVAQTRRLVRGLVVELMALGVPSAQTDGTFAQWACRIAVYAVALDTTLAHLDKRLNG